MFSFAVYRTFFLVIGRCEYNKTCQLLVQLFDTNATTYQELCNTRTSDIDLTIAEGRLTWLVYIIGRLAYL